MIISRRYYFNFTILVSLLSILCIASCAKETLKFPDYHPKKQFKPGYIQEKDGLSVSIIPMLDKEEMETYFKTDLLANNLLAVFVLVENQTASIPYIVTKEDFVLKTKENIKKYDSSKTHIGDDTKAQQLSTLGAFVLAPVIIPIAAGMISDAGTKRHNFLSKEMKASTTLFPGQSTNGFVYFKLPNKMPKGMFLQLESNIKELESGAIITFNYNIEIKGI